MTRAKQNARVSERVCEGMSPFGNIADYPPVEDEFLFSPLAREVDTPEVRARAKAEWDAIPSDLDELRKWMRGEQS